LRYSSLSIDITPQDKVELSGYANRVSNPYSEISTSLEANIVILDKVIFISVDTLYISQDIKEQILNRLKIDEINLFITATHTHFAPALDKTKQALGKVDNNYVSNLIDKLVDAITLSYNHLNPKKNCHLLYGVSKAHHSINRRYKNKDKIVMRPNQKADKDENIHTITIKDFNTVKCIIVNYACHPVSSLKKNNVSSDFIGDIRKSLRKKYKNTTLPVLFFQGFSGDTRPCSIYDNGKRFIDFEKKDLVLWKNSLLRYIDYGLNHITYKLDDFKINTTLDKLDYTDIIKSDYYKGQIIFHKIEFADIIIIGVGSEIVSSYAKYVQDKYKNKICILVSCANSSFGYIPTDKMIIDGGYESNEFFTLFGIKAKFKTKIEEKIKRYL